jgi:hypothetical protein
MIEFERKAWIALKCVVSTFLASNLGALSQQQAERFHQHINGTEGRCQVGRMLT